MAQSILSNAAIATAGRLLNALLGLVTVGLLTRHLGPAGFGDYTLLLSFGALVQLAADFGLYLTLTRVIAQHPEQEHYYLAHTLSLRLVLLVIAFGGGALIALIIPSLARLLSIWGILAIALCFQSLSQLLMGVYQKYGVVWRVLVGDLTGRLLQIGGITLVGYWGGTLWHVIMVYALTSAVAFWLHWQLLPAIRGARLQITWAAWRQLLKVSWPLGAMLVLNAIYFRIDALLLSLYRPAAEVGQYGLAYRVIESALFFPAMFGGLLLPRLSAVLHQHHTAQARRLVEEGLHVLILSAALIVVLLVTLPGSLVELFAGAGFQGAAPILRILSIALAVMFIGNLFGFTLVALQRQRVLLILYGVLVGVNIVANLLAIPRWGALAAAWITVGTEVLATTVAGVVVWRLLRWRLTMWFMARVLLAVLATVILVTILPLSMPVLLQALLATGLYAALSVWLGTLHRRHLSLLTS